jgi:Abnormal spindle-like microcephaly-assoc'd, ASPM-SPD-2-Hydin
LNRHRLIDRWTGCFAVILSTLFFVGCQGLGGQGGGNGSVALANSSLDFGTVAVGSTKNIQDTLTNGTTSSVTISAIQGVDGTLQVTGISLPLVVPAGQSSSFNVQFKPNAPGTTSLTLSYMGDGGQSVASLKVVGQAVAQTQLSANPSSISFGNVPVGSNAGQSVTLVNSGGENVTISAATASGDGFSLSGLTLPLTLSPGASTSFTAKFSPTAPGAANGTITITSDALDSPLSISVSGTAVTQGILNPSPASLSFGNVQVGSNASLNETLSNTGGLPVTITAATASGNGFSLSGLNLPLTLNAGQNTSFTVKFAPSAAGNASGNITVTSNASNSPLSIALSGTGVAPGALSPNPSSLAFGNVQVGSNASLSETLTNTGGSSVTISAASVGNSAYTLIGLTLPVTLNAGQNTSFTVKFSPSAAGAVNANLTITSNAPNSPLTIPLTGTGVAPGTLGANPASLAFGNVQVGGTANLSETLTNTGGSSVTISQANVTGAAFSISGLTVPTTLNPGQSVTFTATFKPTAAGGASGTLSVVSNASNSPLSIPLSGTGTASGQLAVAPSTLAFGSVTVGSSSALNGSLTASGASVTVSSASIDNGEFVLSGITLPQTLTAGQTVPFTVTFTPNATGATSASLTFTSNASNSPTVESLTGTGKAAVPHSVDLNWNSSTGAVSYNIYRKLSTDSGYSQISSFDTTTAFTDNNVTAGQTYDYVVTAVDGNSQESGYSNMAQAIIPTP